MLFFYLNGNCFAKNFLTPYCYPLQITTWCPQALTWAVSVGLTFAKLQSFIAAVSWMCLTFCLFSASNSEAFEFFFSWNRLLWPSKSSPLYYRTRHPLPFPSLSTRSRFCLVPPSQTERCGLMNAINVVHTVQSQTAETLPPFPQPVFLWVLVKTKPQWLAWPGRSVTWFGLPLQFYRDRIPTTDSRKLEREPVCDILSDFRRIGSHCHHKAHGVSLGHRLRVQVRWPCAFLCVFIRCT